MTDFKRLKLVDGSHSSSGLVDEGLQAEFDRRAKVGIKMLVVYGISWLCGVLMIPYNLIGSGP